MAEQTNATTNPVVGFLQNPANRQLVLIMTVAGLAAIVAFFWLWGKEPEYRVLFSNFSDRDGGSIVAELQKMNVPYKYAEGGGAIMVPTERLHDVRFKLAALGLPKGGNVGFELMSNQKMGTSQFLEQINFQRALEGELARSIETISAIQGARVHLALPKPTVFTHERQKPSASVLINLHPGRALDSTQVNAIIHLVASSVPELSAKGVTVVDQNGNLLSEQNGNGKNEPDPMRLKYIQSLQQDTVKRVESILTPILGPGNVHAEATVEVDFSESEQAAESYKPNKPPETASIRSEQTSESQGPPETPAVGVPGALSNQPPTTTAPLPNQPGEASKTVQGAVRKDSTVNYEVDKTVRYVQQPMGSIRRLTVAVVINYRKSGVKPEDAKPLTEEETKQINELVKEAMGYNKERGDSLSIVNSPFLAAAPEVLPELPWWKQPDNIELAKEIGRYLLLAALVLFLYFRVLKPILRKLYPEAFASEEEAKATAEAAAAVGEGEAEAAGTAEEEAQRIYLEKLAEVKKLAQTDPRLVATVIQEWLGLQPKEE